MPARCSEELDTRTILRTGDGKRGVIDKTKLPRTKKAMETRTATGKDRFAKVPIWWAEQVTRGMHCPQMMVAIWMLHLGTWTQDRTFKLSNVQLQKYGVSHDAKTRALRAMEKLGLAKVERRKGKSPTITLLHV